MTNVNEGHRARMRRRMIEEGFHGFEDHEILEILLYQFIPRKDTNKIAHKLLNKFGSFANVFDASPKQLQSVEGISEVTACSLSLQKELWQRYRASTLQKKPMAKLSSILHFAKELIAESYVEKLVAVFVDHATNFISSEEFTSEDPQCVHVDMKKFIMATINSNAAGVLLFHCHVHGICKPSAADNVFTERVFASLANIDVVLLDHLIFNDSSEYFSYHQSGILTRIGEHYRSPYFE